MSTDILAFIAPFAAFIGIPRLAWWVAQRRGASDRRFVRMVVVASLFIIFGLALLVMRSWWFGAYIVSFGLVELWLARWLQRSKQNANRYTATHFFSR